MLEQCGFDKEQIKNFAAALHGTFYPTIDIFLEKKKSFRDLGAHAIALVLLPMEAHRQLFPQRDWYALLYYLLDFEREEPDAGNVTFVTLNYDRSLEHFLRNTVEFNCPEELMGRALAKYNKVSIIHAHGSLGEYPKHAFGYGFSLNAGSLKTGAAGIRIVSDHLDDSDDFKKARKAIADAQNIVFLGVGYDQSTMERLLQDANLAEKTIAGTSVGLGDAQIEDARKLFGAAATVIGRGQTAEGLMRKLFEIKK